MSRRARLLRRIATFVMPPLTLVAVATSPALASPPAIAATSNVSSVAQVASTAEVYNSGRGLYSWLTIPTQIPGWQHSDVYWRDQIQWAAQVEKTRGTYDLSVFEAGMRAAAQNNGRFSFRIMALCPGCGGNLTPSYVPRQPNGAPNWNSEEFLSGYEKLVAAIGAQYNKDPRLGVIDVGGYGMWGEWYCDSSSCGTPITRASTERILRAVSKAFPDKYLTLGFDLENSQLAAQINPKIGMRFDCIGGPFDMTLRYLPESIKDVWKRAPVIGEWCPMTGTTAPRALDHVRELHISALSSGNFPTAYSQLSQSDQAAFRQAYVLSGFRYAVSSVEAPSSVAAGRSAKVNVVLRNSGQAPTYDTWSTRLHVLDSTGRSVASASLATDLRTLAEGSTTATANLTLPRTLRGTYRLAINATDPAGYLKPLSFANPGRDTAGRYVVGSLQVTRS